MDSHTLSRPRAWIAAAAALCAALILAAPAAAGPLGPQFRVSYHAPEGGSRFPDIANNSTTGEHLAVWLGTEFFVGKGGDLPAVHIRRIAADGTPIGEMKEISGPTFAPPSVAYNPDDNEWLVVWVGLDGVVWGTRIAADGSEIGGEFEISDDDSGPANADVAYSPDSKEYMVGFVAGEEAWVHRVSRAGAEIGDDVPLDDSDDVTAGNPGTVSITYNAVSRQFMLVWHGTRTDRGTAGIGGPPARTDEQVYGQPVGTDGAKLGDNIQVSNQNEFVGPSRVAGATVIANSTSGDYLVTWRGEQTAGQDDGDFEVIGQRLTSAGAELGPEYAITEGTVPFKADLAYNPNADEYIAVFHAIEAEERDLDGGEGPSDEVYAQQIGAGGSLLGDRFQVSEMVTEPGADGYGQRPAVTYNPTTCDYASVWFGNRESENPEEETDQVWDRRIAAPACPAAPAAPVAGPTPTAAPAPARPASPRVRVAGVRSSCIRRSTRVRISIALASGVRLTSARVTLNGKRIKTSRRSRFSVTVNPKRLKAGRRYRLRIVARDSAGNRRTITRTIRVCAAQRQRRATPRFTG